MYMDSAQMKNHKDTKIQSFWDVLVIQGYILGGQNWESCQYCRF